MVALGRNRSRRACRERVKAAQPLVVVTEWGAHGAVAVALLFCAIGAAGIVYWRVLSRADPLPLRAALAIAGFGLIAAWCAPVLYSSDVYAYAAYGELARAGLNPYAHAPRTAADALIAAARWQWSGPFPVCVYGPLFVALAAAIVGALAPLGTLAQLQGMRALASAAFLCCIPLAYSAFRGEGSARVRAAAIIGLNPVAIWCAAEGHNDSLALAIALTGFSLVRLRLAGTGAAIVALSGLVKPPGMLAAAALAVLDRRARAGAAFGLALVAVGCVPLVAGIATQLAPHGTYAPQASLQAVLAPFGTIPALLLALVVASVLAIRGCALLQRSVAAGWIWLGLAAWVLVPNPYPWYGIWLVALAALAPTSRAAVVAIAISFTSLLRYVPDAVATPGPWASVALGAAASLPLLLLLRRGLGIMSDSHDG
jgi:hypothetical protein